VLGNAGRSDGSRLHLCYPAGKNRRIYNDGANVDIEDPHHNAHDPCSNGSRPNVRDAVTKILLDEYDQKYSNKLL